MDTKTAEPARARARLRRTLAALEAQHPGADTELVHRNAFELLVATVLSAQSTDARVNEVTAGLFRRYPEPRALAAADPAALEDAIRPTGFFRAKARSLLGLAAALVERHDGEVPASMDALVALPGVGRKTANVVLGHAFGIPGLPVDRHVLRVAGRLGVPGQTPAAVEAALCAALPPARWTVASDTLILHGRRICRPRPACDCCAVRRRCDFARRERAAAARAGPRNAASPRARSGTERVR